MFNYFYYKFYQASLKSSLSDIPEFLAPVLMGGLISANILVINALLAKLDVVPFLFTNHTQGGLFTTVVIIFTRFYYSEARYLLIVKKYVQESEKERIRGNLIVGVFVAVSFMAIFAVSFFKPGVL